MATTTKYWSIDEGSYRIDKNVFPTIDEAIQKASECSRILGRNIAVYEYNDGVRTNYGSVSPDGNLIPGPSATQNPPPAGPGGGSTLDKGELLYPAVLGSVLDDVAEQLEARGASELAHEVDAAHAQLNDVTAEPKIPERRNQAQKLAGRIDDILPEFESTDIYDSLLNIANTCLGAPRHSKQAAQKDIIKIRAKIKALDSKLQAKITQILSDVSEFFDGASANAAKKKPYYEITKKDLLAKVPADKLKGTSDEIYDALEAAHDQIIKEKLKSFNEVGELPNTVLMDIADSKANQ